MRIGAIPETLLERVALWLNIIPTPLGDTHLSFILARAIMEAAKLGIFEALAESPRSAEEVAAICTTEPQATSKLLNALTGARYLKTRDNRYVLTRIARKWLLKESRTSVCDKLMLQFFEWGLVERFGDYVRTGEAIELHDALNKEQWRLYQRGMRDVARLNAWEVGRRTPIPKNARDLLDIGGSHGIYSAELCRRHAKLRAVVLDLPEAIVEAQPLLAREQMDKRVVHEAGNALTYDLGNEKWDVVFISSLVHHFSEAENRSLAKRVAQALRPGGVFVIQDYVRPASIKEAVKAGVGALLDLYFAATSHSGTWTLSEMKSWQQAAGLEPGRAVWFRTIPGHAQQAATKP